MSKTNLDISGIDQIMKNLVKEVRRVEGLSLQGLIQAGTLILRTAEQITPFDTGNLRRSSYLVHNKGTVKLPSPTVNNARGDAAKQVSNQSSAISDALARVSGNQPLVEVGFSTTYAAAVHETHRGRVGDGIVTKGPAPARPKFLESAVKGNANKILDIVRRTAQIP